jgi:hypothetical protein
MLEIGRGKRKEGERRSGSAVVFGSEEGMGRRERAGRWAKREGKRFGESFFIEPFQTFFKLLKL